MKVIDLLNKIANETQPKIIIFDTEKYIWEKEQKEYRRYPYENNLYYSLWSDYNLMKCLNEEVEIIEEDKEIEEIKSHYVLGLDESLERIIEWQKENNKIYEDKINEIIRNHNKIMKNFDELKKGK